MSLRGSAELTARHVGAWFDRMFCLACAAKAGWEDAVFHVVAAVGEDWITALRCPRCGSERTWLRLVAEDAP